MSIQTAEISDDFIGVFDGYFGDEIINRYLLWWKELEEMGMTQPRSGNLSHEKDDMSYDSFSGAFFEHNFNINYVAKPFCEIFWDKIYEQYGKKFSILKDMARHEIIEIKIQKTMPGGGYHIWHPEMQSIHEKGRCLVFMLYLNDVEEGGETEFLYQHKRIQPKRDRFVLWPAYFTHTHRGNPPLSGEKLILTGWVEFTA
jgi:hypothetical protein